MEVGGFVVDIHGNKAYVVGVVGSLTLAMEMARNMKGRKMG